MVVVPVCLNYRCCSSECLVLYRINKDESNESLPLLAFRRDVINAIFLKSSEEGRSSARHVGIRNLPSDVCYDNTKYCQVPSEKQGRCKVCKKNSRRRCIKCKVNMHSMKYAWYAYICMVCMVLKYLMAISECLTAWCYKMYELVLCNILFNYVLKYVLFFFFFFFFLYKVACYLWCSNWFKNETSLTYICKPIQKHIQDPVRHKRGRFLGK